MAPRNDQPPSADLADATDDLPEHETDSTDVDEETPEPEVTPELEPEAEVEPDVEEEQPSADLVDATDDLPERIRVTKPARISTHTGILKFEANFKPITDRGLISLIVKHGVPFEKC